MKTLSIIVSTFFFINSISYSQELETVGAGVIDFLLTNPKTASQTNATEAAALSVIGNLLSISAHRKHEMNVADAVRSEIIINTASGSQATMYSDKQGNIYLLFNGTIYPISSGLVNQARVESVEPKIKNSTLYSYNLAALKDEFRFEKKGFIKTPLLRYFLKEKKETISEIALKHNVSINDILLRPYIIKQRNAIYYPSTLSKSDFLDMPRLKGYNRKYISGIYSSQMSLDRSNRGCFAAFGIRYSFPGYENKLMYAEGFAIFIRKPISLKYAHEIVATFTCNWAKDFDGNGLELDEFHGIKRSFYEAEQVLFVLGYTTEVGGTWELEIYESLTGKSVYKKTGVLEKDFIALSGIKAGEKLPQGVYFYNFKLVSENEKTIFKSEKFEILGSEE